MTPLDVDSELTVLGDDDDGRDTLAGMYLTFILENQDYGLEIRHVTEIIRMQTITEIPDVPGFIRGVINLRGKIIPVMDLRLRFHLSPQDYDERTCVVVVNIEGSETGLIVDRMKEVSNIPESRIQPPPAGTDLAGEAFINGLGRADNKVHILLDVPKVVRFSEPAVTAED